MSTREKPRTYGDDEREQALALYKAVGPAEAGRRLGIPAGTIRTWASRAHLTEDAGAQTAAAVEAARRSWAQRRGELTDEVGLAASEVLGRLRRSRSALEAQRFANTLGTLIEKVELLEGRATERVEVSESDMRDEVRHLRDEVAARRAAKSA